MASAAEYLSGSGQPPQATSRLGVGRADLTVKLRNQYGKYNISTQVDGDGSPLKWEDWLNQNGYALDANGLVYPTK